MERKSSRVILLGILTLWKPAAIGASQRTDFISACRVNVVVLRRLMSNAARAVARVFGVGMGMRINQLSRQAFTVLASGMAG